jgi:hypothetical protein
MNPMGMYHIKNIGAKIFAGLATLILSDPGKSSPYG